MKELDRIAALYPTLMRSMSRLRDVLQEGMDLSYNQYKALLTVSDLSRCSLADLSTQLRVAMSSASEMVDRLEKCRLVKREMDGGDRRAVTIRLTRQGERLLSRIREGIVENYRRVLEHLPSEQRKRLARAIEDLVETLSMVEEGR